MKSVSTQKGAGVWSMEVVVDVVDVVVLEELLLSEDPGAVVGFGSPGVGVPSGPIVISGRSGR